MRTVHRWVGTAIAPFVLWFAATGIGVQVVDLATLVANAPAEDPNMVAIRESIDGPPNLAVIRTRDYTGATLPTHFDYSAAVQRAAAAARGGGGHSAIRYVELRMAKHGPEADVAAGTRVVRFQADSGVRLPDAAPPAERRGDGSAHQTVKRLHRLWWLGDDMLWINALVGVGLCAMIVTGLTVYFRLLANRARSRRRNPFWSAGGPWRSLHRGVSIVAALLILVVAVSGTLLSVDSLAFGLYRGLYPDRLVGGFSPAGTVSDYSRPLSDRDLSAMLQTTLAAYRAQYTDRPIKVLRLRNFAGMPQGVIVTGGEATAQLIYNARTGDIAGLSGRGFPYTGFPLGWQWHELVKKIHRGDAFGMPGRWLSLAAGLALAFLTVSGLSLYLDLLRRRRAAGRRQLFWS